MPVGDVSRHLLDGMLESSDSISLKNVKKEEGNKFKKEERNTEEYFVLPCLVHCCLCDSIYVNLYAAN
jgi:hypothetical protein